MNCTTTGVGGFPVIPCEEIPSETELVCDCPECVRELQFTYNGSPCEPPFAASGRCVDFTPTPFVADILCTSADDPADVVVTGQFQKGETVTIGAPTGACVPDTLVCSIASPEGLLSQTFEVDSSCDGGRGLILLNNYGAFTSIGYSCDVTEQRNCITEVIYELEVCNQGSQPEIIYDWNFILNGTVTDLVGGIEDNTLLTGECLEATITEFVNRCAEMEYCANSTANATNPTTGVPFPPCDDFEEIKFSFNTFTLPPTSMPR